MKNMYTLFQIVLELLPVFLLTIAGWSSGILFTTFILSSMLLVVDYRRDVPVNLNDKSYVWCFSVTLALPVIAIFLSQLFGQDIVWRNYDGPARFLLCIPVFLILVKNKIDVLKVLTYSIPCSLFATVLLVTLHPNLTWSPLCDPMLLFPCDLPKRITTSFVDPLTFGSLNITFCLFSLMSIDLYEADSRHTKSLKYLGFIIGMYLSIISGSRTGWLALPLMLLIWIFCSFKKRHVLVCMLALFFMCLGLYYLTSAHERIDSAIQDVINYRWNAVNKRTSIGDRISFFRMAVFLFMQNPLSGFGDSGFIGWINHPELSRFALQSTQEFALRSKFHNEITTNMVKSGIWGLLSSSALFIVPAIIFFKKMRSTSVQVKKIAILGLGYLICTFISGMTTEVFNLKFTASFHGLMLTCLISSLIINSKQKNL